MKKQKKFQPINSKFPHFYHGADYNPDQWLHRPDILEEDLRLMKLANCNVMSVGIFAWSALEPEEGEFTFQWLDDLMDRFAENGIYVILATPSGARPAWLSEKYPEVLRVEADRRRIEHGNRHNHCYTSPIYRQKIEIINRKLADRYKDHPALLLWHISNEYGGECHCELCQEEFRKWLKNKYQSLKKLNQAWWTSFWSHKYTDWSQIVSPRPYPHGEQSIHGLNLDWKRFVTKQTVDFYKHEVRPIKEITPEIPATTNLMGTYPGLDYWKFADIVDVISWDNYPLWHNCWQEEWQTAVETAFKHDINRTLKKGKPFMLMESTPSVTNWSEVSKLKRPGMHLLSSMQAVAHGSDTVQYFQWRKSRGSVEKLHGAVVDHVGHENTRVFQEVLELGRILRNLDELIGTSVEAEVAIVYDWENRWALEDAKGFRSEKKYEETCIRHYRSFWKQGIPVDIVNEDCSLDQYKLVIAPMTYMVKDKFADNVKKFVKDGGIFVSTYFSGIVGKNDLCFLDAFPGPLKDILGIWSEEIDGLYDEDKNHIIFAKGNHLGLRGEFKVGEICDLIHTVTAEKLASYKSDFYAGRPALTVNKYGQGKAYYICSRNEDIFLDNFYKKLKEEAELEPVLDIDLAEGLSLQKRTDGRTDYIFIMNFTDKIKKLSLPDEYFDDFLSGEKIKGEVKLNPYGIKIIKKA